MTEIATEPSINNDEEYLQKFGYRSYDGQKTRGSRRILSLVWFEVTSTWKKSLIGRILLIILLVINAFTIIFLSFLPVDAGGNSSDEAIKDRLRENIAEYMTISEPPVNGGTGSFTLDFGLTLGILLIALFGISGGGLLADDRQGNVVEVYMSKIQRRDYIIGKVGASMAYTNVFILVPLMLITFLTAQSLDVDHIDIIDIYAGTILYSLILSFILSLGILSLSVIMKRNYASLSFFLIYLLGSVFGGLIAGIESSNELLLLVSPEYFFLFLAYVCLGDNTLGIFGGFDPTTFEVITTPFLLNDGFGLEYYHVILVALGYIVVLGGFLYYKIRRMTTEDM